MLENASQGIACYFNASQGLKYMPSWVCSIAACGWPLKGGGDKRGCLLCLYTDQSEVDVFVTKRGIYLTLPQSNDVCIYKYSDVWESSLSNFIFK